MTGPPVVPDPARTARVDRLVPWALALLAAAPRLLALDLRPLHHDEGSNAIFVLRLLHEGVYRYDPTNYHGPSLYYLSAAALALLGTTTVTFRLVPALLGSALAPLAWGLRDAIGRAAAGAAGLLLALSPTLVYYARDNIHETYLIAFTLLLVVGLERFLRTGRGLWIILAGMAAGAIIATKETAPLVFGSLLLAAAAAHPRPGRRARPTTLLGGVAAGLLVAGALYSRGFSEPDGLLGPVRALRLWGARAVSGDGHVKEWWYFLGILARQEPAILAAALAGGALVLIRRSRSGLFVAAWAVTTLAAYSAIPYKTPWIVLNIILPLAILAGMAFGAGIESSSGRRRRAASVALFVAATISLAQAVVVSFARYDDDRIPIVYVQTRRDALRLVRRVEEVASKDPRGRALPVEILSPDYLPLNWYLRDFTNVAYFGHPIEHPSAPLVIARSDSAAEVAARLEPGYRREEYDLRPGVRLCLFVRQEGGAGL